MSDADREVAARGARDERSAAGSSFRLRFVSPRPGRLPPLLRRRRESGAVVRPARALGPEAGSRTPISSGRGRTATSRRTARSPPRRSKSSTECPRRRCSSRTTTSTSSPRSCGPRAPRRGSRTSSTSRGSGPDGWAVLPPAIARAIHEGLLACDSVGFHTERWRSAFVESCEALLGRGAEAERCSHANPITVDAAEFDELVAGDGVRARREELVARRPGDPRPAGRPHRPVEERRAGVRGVRPPPGAGARRCTAGSACSRCSSRPARRFPSTWTTGWRSRRRLPTSTGASGGPAGSRSSSTSATISSPPSPPTPSTTCSSSTRSWTDSTSWPRRRRSSTRGTA